jgi:hypothetical protein
MSEKKYSHGRWEKQFRNVVAIAYGRTSIVAEVFGYTTEQMLANIHLIAAAPELLEALESIFEKVEKAVDRVGSYYLSNHDRLKVKRAIAKAKGEKE